MPRNALKKFFSEIIFQDCDSEFSDPPIILENPYDEPEYEEIDRIAEEYETEEYESELKIDPHWKSPVDLTRDFLGSLAFAGQAIFAPWTLPGQPFSVDPEYQDY